jgi:hypothetical protein
MKKLNLLLILPSILLMSCAKEETESIETVQDRLLKSYITVVHLDTLQPTSLGYYVIKISEGTGATPKIGDWIKWDQVQRSLDETVISVTEKTDAIKYGQYSADMQTVHYVPNYAYLDENYVTQCLLDIFPKMKAGAKYRLFVPARLMNPKGGSVQSGYQSYILDITLREVIESPQQYELNQVLDYRSTYYPEITISDSIKNGLYYKTTYLAPDTVWQLDSDGILQPILKDTTSAVKDKTVYVTYVGRFLDGFVFDTNIIDSAKAHNIYDPSRSYDTLSFVIGGGSVVEGFDKMVQQMKTGDKGIAFFTSEWGYSVYGKSATGSTDIYGQPQQTSNTSTIIQPYTPLFFDVRLHKITK